MNQSYAQSLTKRDPLTIIKKELVRKVIHILVAITPSLALHNYYLTLSLLSAGIFLYAGSEYLRRQDIAVPVISKLTSLASRDRDKGHFVLGPVTLGLGALLSLMLYKPIPASIAIYALAFGDGLSSLAGKTFGGVKIPYSGGKTVVGSTTCFTAVFLVCFSVYGNLFASIVIAVVATFLEMLPSKDLDNIIIPLGTGLVASFLF